MLKMTNTTLFNKADFYILETLKEIYNQGSKTEDIGNTKSYFPDGTRADTKFVTFKRYEYDISKNEFPISTLRKVYWENAIKELFWIYQDQSNDLNVLRDKYNVKYWNPFDVGDGTIGNRYGAIVRKYDIINKEIINRLSADKTDRRAMIDLWQYTDIQDTPGLPSCAFNAMFMVRDEFLDMMLTQRSNDILPAFSINQIQYVALQMMIAHVLGLKAGKFVHSVGNIHYYNKHEKIVEEFLKKEPSTQQPILKFSPKSNNFEDFTIDDFSVENYEPDAFNEKLEIALGVF